MQALQDGARGLRVRVADCDGLGDAAGTVENVPGVEGADHAFWISKLA